MTHKLKPSARLVWTPDLLLSFDKVKTAIADAALLSYAKENVPLALVCDASDRAVGSVLEQCVDHVWQPIAFFSRILHTHEKTWSAYDKELLAVYLSVKNFKHHLEGRPFRIYTDHKPLVDSISKQTEAQNPRQQRQLAYILSLIHI